MFVMGDFIVSRTKISRLPVHCGWRWSVAGSVASAVGAAYLFGGRAARSEVTVNGEIEFMTQYAGEWNRGMALIIRVQSC